MPHATSDRNLLFGILALQLDFISRDALIAAMHAWVLDKVKPLGQILQEQGAIADDNRALLEALVQKHLDMHGHDPQKSLAAVSSVGSVRAALQQIADLDLHASLAHISAHGTAQPDPHATKPPTAGAPTSAGVRFRILRPHAKGALGEVFVAHDEELYREVALKQILDKYADDPESRARFLLEGQLTGGLEHPGIVPVYGLGQYADGRPYYAMRFIQGDSLKDAVEHFHKADVPGRDPGQRTLALRGLLGRFVDVCNAVAYAHSRGVLHRDLKPGNILLGKYGETLVVDWGLAKPVGRPECLDKAADGTLFPPAAADVTPTQVGATIGTPAYMSPEQAAGRVDELGLASDIYSLGATLYTVLTGMSPFDGMHVGEVLAKVVRGDFPPPRQVKRAVPAALEAICLRAMALRPANRYAAPRALADDVEHWLADEPVMAYRESLLSRSRRWGRRHRSAVAGAAGLLVTVILALVIGLVAVNAERRQTETAQALAEERFELAKQAVEKYLTAVAESPELKHTPKMHGLRKRLLEAAVPFYEKLAAHRSGDARQEAESGRAYGRLAYVRTEMGETEQAVAGYRQEQAIFTRLADEHPAVPGYRHELAGSRNNLGNLLARRGKWVEAEAEHRGALKERQRLAGEHPGVPAGRQAQAQSRSNLGNLLAGRGKPAEAEVEYRAAIEEQQRLAGQHPAEPGYRHDLAGSRNNLGFLMAGLGKWEEAEVEYRAAIEERNRLAGEHPAEPEYRKELARTRSALGALMYGLGRRDEAEAEYLAALKELQGLANEHPAVPDYREWMAAIRTNLGGLLLGLSKWAEAEAQCRAAIVERQRLVDEYPAEPEYRQALADSRQGLGVLMASLGRGTRAEVQFRARAEAEVQFRAALEERQQLADKHLAVAEYQNALARTLYCFALLLRDKKEFVGARQLLKRARPHHQAALQADPRDPTYRLSFRNHNSTMAVTLADLGDHVAAARATAELLQLAFDPANDAYQAACVLSRCVPLAEKDAELPEAKRMELAATYSERAMGVLRQAVAKGLKNVTALKKDADLDPLRQREDFQKLLRELEAKKP
jgi:eukaryotic-like serine/threonine-protein kinase